MPKKVIDPQKQVTDPVLLRELNRQGIDKDYVELFQDYALRSLGKEHSPYAKFYRDRQSNKRFIVVSGLPMVDADGVKIEAGWRVAGINYFSEKNNLFRAKVQGTDVELVIRNDQPDGRKANDRLSYKPQLFLDGIEKTWIQQSLLPVDPVNPNYQENTLEWDYGICKRRLRIIEGSVLGSWVFASKPNGEIRIKYNQIGDYRLKLGQFKVSDDEEVIKPEDFDSLVKLQGGYPVTVSDSATYYPDPHEETTSVDGSVQRNPAQESWSAIHDSVGTSANDSATALYLIEAYSGATSPLWIEVRRGIVLFDLSPLPAGAIISAVTESVRGQGKVDDYPWNPTINVYSANPASNIGLVVADYLYTVFGTTAYCDTAITYAGWSITDYNNWAFNATGIAAAQAAANANTVLKTGIRSNFDVANSAPSPWAQYNHFSVDGWASEKGNGYKPKLVVTYVVLTILWNIVTNGSFEYGDPPTGWTKVGAGASFSRSTDQVKTGTYSGKVTRVNFNCFCYQTLLNPTDYRGKTLIFGCWVYATVASRARLIIGGDITANAYSSYHSGGSSWEWLTISQTINGAETNIYIYCSIDTGNTSAYFDGAICIEGTSFPTTTLPKAICEIAWTNNPFDATPTWVDVSADLMSYFIKRGRQYEVDLFEAGEATITLLNHSGNYWPDNGASAYDPDVLIGKRVRLSTFYNNIWYSRYVGYIENFTPQWGLRGLLDPRMQLTCGDALSLIARQAINTTYAVTTTGSGERVTDVLDDTLFMAADRAIDAGKFEIQAITLTNTSALDHIKTVAISEIGLFYIDREGIATYEDRSHRSLSPHTVSQGTFETNYPDIEISLDDHLLFNEVRATRIGGAAEQVSYDTSSQTAYQLHDLIRGGLLHIKDVVSLFYADYLVARYKTPYTRAVSLTLLPTRNPSTLFPYALGFDFSTRITVTVPSPSGITALDCFIENIEERFDATQPELWQFKWLLSNATGYTPSTKAETETILPDADGTLNDWGADAGWWVAVADGNDATYIANGASLGRITAKLEPVSFVASSISTITVYIRAWGYSTTYGKFKISIYTNGGPQDDAVEYQTTATKTTYSKTWALNPATGNPWTPAEITALEIGMNSTLDSCYVGFIDGWVDVTYAPAW